LPETLSVPSRKGYVFKGYYSGGIRVTNLEKTLVDSVKDMDKISGIEEIIAFIRSIPRLDEQKLCQYLEEYQNQFLYQKLGYLLETYSKAVGLTDTFFNTCLSHIGKSKRYSSFAFVNR
jgi:predicted transcriptional regulator of viral defense system